MKNGAILSNPQNRCRLAPKALTPILGDNLAKNTRHKGGTGGHGVAAAAGPLPRWRFPDARRDYRMLALTVTLPLLLPMVRDTVIGLLIGRLGTPTAPISNAYRPPPKGTTAASRGTPPSAP